MGIEHRMKDESDTEYWKCPHCNAVGELETATSLCVECGEGVEPHESPATWLEFWEYCNSLKTQLAETTTISHTKAPTIKEPLCQ